MEITRFCAVCSNECKFKCGGCHAKFYCGEPHQIQDWPSHSKLCYPVIELQTKSSDERRLVAARSIKALETILIEKPLVCGPVPSFHSRAAKNACPICYKVCSSVRVSCPKCSVIMCSSTCHKNKDHIPECTFLKVARPAAIRKLGDSLKPYNLILMFRCLWMKHAHPDSWNILLQIKGDTVDAMEKKQIRNAKKLKDAYKLNKFTVAEINRAYIYALYLVQALEGGEGGIYPNNSLIGSYCSENTMILINKEKEIVLKAARDIKKYELFSKPGLFPFYGVYTRRMKRESLLMEIICNCDKCQDPTDMGTYNSSMYCLSCKTGRLLPQILSKNEWWCDSCNTTESGWLVESILNRFHVRLNKASNIYLLKTFLEITEKTLCENNFLRLKAKFNLCTCYAMEIISNFTTLEIYDTDFFSLVQEVTHVLCKVCPEYVRERGLLYFHIIYPLIIQLRDLDNKEKLIGARGLYEKIRYILAVNHKYPNKKFDTSIVKEAKFWIKTMLKYLCSQYSKTN